MGTSSPVGATPAEGSEALESTESSLLVRIPLDRIGARGLRGFGANLSASISPRAGNGALKTPEPSLLDRAGVRCARASGANLVAVSISPRDGSGAMETLESSPLERAGARCATSLRNESSNRVRFSGYNSGRTASCGLRRVPLVRSLSRNGPGNPLANLALRSLGEADKPQASQLPSFVRPCNFTPRVDPFTEIERKPKVNWPGLLHGSKGIKLRPPSETFNTAPPSSRSNWMKANFSGTFRNVLRRSRFTFMRLLGFII